MTLTALAAVFFYHSIPQIVSFLIMAQSAVEVGFLSFPKVLREHRKALAVYGQLYSCLALKGDQI